MYLIKLNTVLKLYIQKKINELSLIELIDFFKFKILLGEFDPGSERTLVACLIHASRTRKPFGVSIVAHG